MPIRNLSLYDFHEHFSTEENCLRVYAQLRWKGQPTCPYCNKKEVYEYKSRPIYRCKKCDKQFGPKTNTIFSKSSIPLQKWFLVYYLMSTNKKGLSSVQIAKYAKLKQKTAWRMMQKIRKNFGSVKTKLTGVIEVDEVYIGPKKKGSKRGRGTSKTPVFGMLQRDGNLKIMPVASVKGRSLQKLIRENVELGSTIMSDEFRAYWGLEKLYIHKTVLHAEKEYVNGDAHVNGLEGAWSHLRRLTRGTYQRPSKRYLDLYCNEFEFRYNNRNKALYVQFTNALKQASQRVKDKDIFFKKPQ